MRKARGKNEDDPRGSGSARRLFSLDECAARPTTMQRLKRLARRPPLPLSERQLRADEDVAALRMLRDWAVVLCREFGLELLGVFAEQEHVTEWYGICYEDGEIRIRLRHALTGRLLKESSLCDTLCHELAHLRHLDHSIRFRRLYRQILDRARELGYYRPGPSERGPIQLGLFDETCGARRAAALKGRSPRR